MDLVSSGEMMELISHRGNLDGPDPSKENNPKYIVQAIDLGYSVEIDLRMHDKKIMLGHDIAQYEIGINFLEQYASRLWIHCKDKESLEFAMNHTNNNFFWHDTDDYTMTSWKYVWAYPGKEPVGKFCVMVMPELHWKIEEIVNFKTYGVCSDYVETLKNYK
jgi:hypothetical protein